MTDRQCREFGLREAVCRGDEAAWKLWYDAEYPALAGFVRWRCGQIKHLAEDVLQETWMTAVRKIRDFRPESGSFHHWLCGIAANVIRNQIRSNTRRAVQTLSGNEVSVVCTDGWKVVEALAGLPVRSELVLRLKYLEGRTVAEIASLWNESEKSVESLLSRARAAFRTAFGSDE